MYILLCKSLCKLVNPHFSRLAMKVGNRSSNVLLLLIKMHCIRQKQCLYNSNRPKS